MKRREFITLLGGAATAWPIATTAQQSDSGRQVRIGVVAAVPPSPDMLNAFRDAMRDRGYVRQRLRSVEKGPILHARYPSGRLMCFHFLPWLDPFSLSLAPLPHAAAPAGCNLGSVDDFAIYLDRNGWQITSKLKAACKLKDSLEEDLWGMNHKSTATPLWATEMFTDNTPERKIAYRPCPNAAELIFGFRYGFGEL